MKESTMRANDAGRSRLPQGVAWGIGLAAVTAVISGISVYLNAFAVKQVPDAALFTTLKNGVAALLLLGALIAAPSARGAVRRLSGRQWLGLVAIGIVGGSIPFLLFFNGLAMASAPSAAVIHKTLFIWVALLAVPLLGERVGWPQIAALGALLFAQLLIQPVGGVTWGPGETLIALATGLWAVEVILARRLLRDVPSLVGGAGRMAIGLVILTGYLVLTGRGGEVAGLGGVQWAWIAGSGVLLAGYVGTWYAALRRAPATVVTCVLVAGAPITALLTSVGTGTIPVAGPLAGYLLVLVGVAVMAGIALTRGMETASSPVR
jgi:drug/metabolite transporter (DMT)-like permease